jgi:hypothetical protein
MAALLLLASSRAGAYTEELPPRLTATSASGVFKATLVPGRVGQEAEATLEVRRRGRVVWRAGVLWGGHGHLALADGGHLATIDDRPGRLGQHVVVIYDPRGALVADLAVRDLLSPEESRQIGGAFDSWRYGGDEPAILGGHLFITARWGPTIGVRLEDGKVTRDFRRFGRVTDYLSGALASEERIISVRRAAPSADGADRAHCALSASGCRCHRETPLGEVRGAGWTRPLAPARWKALVGQAAALVPLIETSPTFVADPTKVQIELSIRRKHATRCDAYAATLDPRKAQGDVAALLQGLLEITGL